mgnify:CR=1|jgi:hypothetical protein|tara:strand:- start:117 stop:338 length:222 start_codon:yes stop_codon:yes gene_type:complete
MRDGAPLWRGCNGAGGSDQGDVRPKPERAKYRIDITIIFAPVAFWKQNVSGRNSIPSGVNCPENRPEMQSNGG